MIGKNCFRVIEWAVALGWIGAVLAVGGCGSQRLRGADDLPDDSQLVGGGLNVTWRAPAAGTVYVVEKRTGKLIETRSLAQGEAYSFKVESAVRAQELQDMLGISFSKTEFLLYFKPANRQG
jgi:hypothetical protein